MGVRAWTGSAPSQLPLATGEGVEEDEYAFSQRTTQDIPATPGAAGSEQGHLHQTVHGCNRGACAAMLPPGPPRSPSSAGGAAPHLASEQGATLHEKSNGPPQFAEVVSDEDRRTPRGCPRWKGGVRGT